ncbi:MAG TPA: iron-containing alcohol dehydrogenase [Lachnospiraceae bacterium]|nr:iron-containing alcohol dehydrogenase [Lachnospiraceae bacterium]
MEFYIPAKIYHEDGAVLKHGKELASLGRKAFIVTGKSSAVKTGALDDVIKALEDSDTGYILYDKIEENPSVETVMEAADTGRDQGADFVIGIGGGSPMDAAKAIALMVQNRDTSGEILYQDIKIKALPVAEIPTTCGTGSEVTPYSILTRNDKKTKQSIRHKVYPAIACIDAKYLKHAPVSVIRNTAIDALGHLLESYFNKKATDYTRMLCQHGLMAWAKNRTVLSCGTEFTDENYNQLLFASTLAGMAISHTGTSIPHGLSYYMTYNKNIPHGKAVGMFLPGYLALIEKNLVPGYSDVIAGMGFNNLEEFKAFIGHCLGEYCITDEDAGKMVQEMLGNPQKLSSVPFETGEEELQDIIKYAR